jgi:hypothetical protein
MSLARRNLLREAERVLARHPHLYQRDPGSGAGNCWCGASDRDSIHLTTQERRDARR